MQVLPSCSRGEKKLTNGQVGWVGTVALMMKTQIGLGVLSIPATFDTLGLIPGLICLLAIAGITTWSDHIVGVFKRRHPEVYGIDDAGGLMFGRIGREAFGAAFCVCTCPSGLVSSFFPAGRLRQMVFLDARC